MGVMARAGGCRDVLLCVVELPVFVGVVTGFCVGFAPCVSFVFVGVWAAGFRGVLWPDRKTDVNNPLKKVGT